jgi:hypothetical protein
VCIALQLPDALIRRVWMSTRWRCAPSADFGCIANAVTRTVWDGASEVAEIRARYDTSDATHEEIDAGAPLVPQRSWEMRIRSTGGWCMARGWRLISRRA